MSTALLRAWKACSPELLAFLRHRAPHREDAEEVLQEVFIKALGQGEAFCAIANPRAWLFQVARNALTDRMRQAREHLPLPEDIAAPPAELPPPVDGLSQCIPRVLSELSAADRLTICFCDMEGKSQQQLAEYLGITLAAAKSRIQRARQRLRARMETACQVRFDAEGSVCCFTLRSPL